MFLMFANMCRSVGFLIQGSAKIVALNLEECYRSAKSLQKRASFFTKIFAHMFFCSVLGFILVSFFLPYLALLNSSSEKKIRNKPGTAQVGAISKAQKWHKDFKVLSILFYSTRMRKKLKKILIFFQFFFGPR